MRGGGHWSAWTGQQAFSPKWISGLVGWYRADLGVTLNVGNVSQWSDQSGTGSHLVQATALNQPQFAASAFGGQPGVSAQDAARWLVTASPVSGMTGSPAHTIIVCYKRNNTTDSFFGAATVGYVPGSFGTSAIGPVSGAPSAVWFGGYNLGGPTGGSVDVNAHVMTKDVTATTSVINAFVDGVQVVTSTASSTAYAAVDGNLTAFRHASGATSAQVTIAEMAFYNRVLSRTEEQNVERYMKARYGTP